jgi:hypothetical protein
MKLRFGASAAKCGVDRGAKNACSAQTGSKARLLHRAHRPPLNRDLADEHRRQLRRGAERSGCHRCHLVLESADLLGSERKHSGLESCGNRKKWRSVSTSTPSS